MPPTVEETLSYYSSQLIIQYNGLPNASQTIEALANCSVCDGFFYTLQGCFNINPDLGPTAVGDQLTIIGNIVGVPRNIYGLDLTDTFFTFSNWAGQPASVGFNTWANVTPDPDKIASWLSTASYVPTDFEMLALIQLKIIANTYFTSLGQIVPPLYELFGGAISIVDNSITPIYTNLIIDGAFALWNSSSVLTDWTTVGGTVTQTTNPVYPGNTYSAGLSSMGSIAQNYAGYASLIGQTVTFSCYVYSSTVGGAEIAIRDGVGAAGVSNTLINTWQLLTVSYTLMAGASSLQFNCLVNGSATGYFDNAFATVPSIYTFNRSISYNFQQPYHNVGSVAEFLGYIVPKPMGVPVTYNLV